MSGEESELRRRGEGGEGGEERGGRRGRRGEGGEGRRGEERGEEGKEERTCYCRKCMSIMCSNFKAQIFNSHSVSG